MHAGMSITHQHAHPRVRHYKTEEERQRDQALRNERRLHRISSLFASIISPFMTLLALPGLTEFWYVKRSPQGLIVHSQPDPPLLVAAGGIMLALSILSNLFMLLRLVGTHPRFCTFFAITLLSFHVLLTLLSTLIFSLPRIRIADGMVLSTAFWLTVASGTVAFAVLSFLSLDGLMTRGWKKGGTGLSGKQRSLVVAFAGFMGIICIGAVANKYLNKLTFIESLYYTIQTALTVGFGDITPISTGSRVFSIAFDGFSIVAFAIVIAFLRATVLEKMESQYQSSEKMILAQFRGKHRNPKHTWSRKLSRWLRLGWVDAEDEKEIEEEQEAEQEAEDDETVVEMDYQEAVEELTAERRREFRSQVVVSGFCLLLVWILGAIAYSRIEGWSFGIAFYFLFITFTSIGYGDYYPLTPAGQAYFCIWSLLGAASITVFFSVVADFYAKRFKETKQRSIWSRMMLKIWKDPHLEARTHEEEKEANELDAAGFDEQEGGKEKPSSEKKKDSEQETLSETLLGLLAETKLHLEELIKSDGGQGGSEGMDRVVKEVMDSQKFTIDNRQSVDNDPDLKRFLYLRRIQQHFALLEKASHEVVEKLKDDEKPKTFNAEELEDAHDRDELEPNSHQ